MAQADWDEVTILRKKQPKASQLRSQQVTVHVICVIVFCSCVLTVLSQVGLIKITACKGGTNLRVQSLIGLTH